MIVTFAGSALCACAKRHSSSGRLRRNPSRAVAAERRSSECSGSWPRTGPASTGFSRPTVAGVQRSSQCSAPSISLKLARYPERRNSPSTITGIPIASWRAMSSRIASSWIRVSVASSAWAANASRSARRTQHAPDVVDAQSRELSHGDRRGYRARSLARRCAAPAAPIAGSADGERTDSVTGAMRCAPAAVGPDRRPAAAG